MDFTLKYKIDKVCIEGEDGTVVAEFDTVEEAQAHVDALNSQSTICGFIVAKEAPDLRTYDIPEKAVSSQEAADLISRFTIDELGGENG